MTALEVRIQQLEESISNIQRILENAISASQTQQLNVLFQTNIDSINDRLATIETDIKSLQNLHLA